MTDGHDGLPIQNFVLEGAPWEVKGHKDAPWWRRQGVAPF
jgi:hypothetical protein